MLAVLCASSAGVLCASGAGVLYVSCASCAAVLCASSAGVLYVSCVGVLAVLAVLCAICVAVLCASCVAVLCASGASCAVCCTVMHVLLPPPPAWLGCGRLCFSGSGGQARKCVALSLILTPAQRVQSSPCLYLVSGIKLNHMHAH